MGESLLERHGATALKGNESNGNGDYQKENIWFEWGNAEEHTVRLVGDFRHFKTHWIGESKFGNDIDILNPGAFKGDGKLPMSVVCGNWNINSECEDTDKSDDEYCPVCRLGRNAERMLKYFGDKLTDKDKENLKLIRKKCVPKSVYMFKCIDRDNPYVDDEKTRKGYKIMKMPAELLRAIIELSKKMNGVSIISPDEGIDITIKRTKPDKGKTTYTVLPVMDGMTVKQTPLTADELDYRDLDLTKFGGKPIDREKFEEELTDKNNVRTVYENSDIESEPSGGRIDDMGNLPF